MFEILMALGILTTVMAVAYAAITQVVKMQIDQEAITTSQNKLRRTSEFVSQDLRSAVYGSVSSQPYLSSQSAIAMAILDSTAGFQVLPHDSGSNASFKAAAEVKMLSLSDTAEGTGLTVGGRVLMINANGVGVFLPISQFGQWGAGQRYWRITHAGCGNTIDYTDDTLIYAVRQVGYRYSSSDKILYRQVGASEEPVAFNITRFSLRYIYRNNSGSDVTEPTGYAARGYPAMQFSSGGQNYTLQRISLLMSTDQQTLGRRIERTLTSQIELPSSNNLRLKEIVPCS